MQEYINLGKSLYNMDNPREARRMVVFVLRSMWRNAGMKKMMEYFQADEQLRHLCADGAFPLEQVTRAFFYKGSTFAERCQLVREHYDFLKEKLQPEDFYEISSFKGDVLGRQLWSCDADEQVLQAMLAINPGQRKEGLLSLELMLGDEYLYQLMFWLAKDKQGDMSLWVGALQGPNMDDARDIIKRITKLCHGYRTKNLVLYIARGVCRALGVKHIYAVTNEGYYANNHARVDRKLKTSFSDFWAEAGGSPTEDSRWYRIPLVEERKTMEEVPTRKRAVYRRRFALLDEIDVQIEANVKAMCKDFS